MLCLNECFFEFLFAFIQFWEGIFNSCASCNNFGNVIFNPQLGYKKFLFFCAFVYASFCTWKHAPSSLPELLNILLCWLSQSVYLPSSTYTWGLWFLPCLYREQIFSTAFEKEYISYGTSWASKLVLKPSFQIFSSHCPLFI